MTVREFTEDLFWNSRIAPGMMTLEEAYADIENFSRLEDIEMPEDITPEEYMEIWNGLVFEQKKTWFLVDNCIKSKSQIFEEDIKTQDKAEALEYARYEWDALSEHDRDMRDEFYICLAMPNEDGYPDYETIAEIEYIK